MENYDPYATIAITPCPYYKNKTIGSIGCVSCKYFKSNDKENLIINCTKDEVKNV